MKVSEGQFPVAALGDPPLARGVERCLSRFCRNAGGGAGPLADQLQLLVENRCSSSFSMFFSRLARV